MCTLRTISSFLIFNYRVVKVCASAGTANKRTCGIEWWHGSIVVEFDLRLPCRGPEATSVDGRGLNYLITNIQSTTLSYWLKSMCLALTIHGIVSRVIFERLIRIFSFPYPSCNIVTRQDYHDTRRCPYRKVGERILPIFWYIRQSS